MKHRKSGNYTFKHSVQFLILRYLSFSENLYDICKCSNSYSSRNQRYAVCNMHKLKSKHYVHYIEIANCKIYHEPFQRSPVTYFSVKKQRRYAHRNNRIQCKYSGHL